MMKRVKRKYIRKAITTPVEPSTEGIESEGSTNTDIVEPTVKGFSFEDLPLSIRIQVENTLKMRKRLKLPDDSVERRLRAIKMFRGDKVR